jgi:hypothetical protein
MPEVEPAMHRQIAELHRFGNSWINSREPWLQAASIAFTNVLNMRPPDNKIPELCLKRDDIKAIDPTYDWPPLSSDRKYLHPQWLPHIWRLHEELAACRPNLVVAMGNTACWALLRATNITQIRGAITQGAGAASGLKILPTFHPASVLYSGTTSGWSWRPIIVADLMKAAREMQFADIQRPERAVIVQPSLDEFEQWVQQILRRRPALLACDTETSLGMIDTIGFAESPATGIVVQVGPHRTRRGDNYTTIWPSRDGLRRVSYWSELEEPRFWNLVNDIMRSGIPLLFQNGLYDLQYLLRMGLRPANVAEDTMLLHHSLFPELPKGLGFLGSIYTNEASWKLMHGLTDTEKRDE